MSTDVAVHSTADLLERVVVGGDLSKLASGERMAYYKKVCESIGLNPLTRPLGYLTLSGRLVLYALREATDQLRAIHSVSIERLERELTEGIYSVTAYARDMKGRTDTSIGAVSVENLKGEARANAYMKAETKAKRRVTLSLCGLGMLDESEVDSIPGAMVGEPPTAPPSSVDDADRHRFLDVIDSRSRELGLTKREYRQNWDRYMGNVATERAQIADLMALADYLAARLEMKKTGDELPIQKDVPF